MEFFNECFDVEFFTWLLRLCAAGVGCGVLLPVVPWALGMVVSLVAKIFRSA